MCSLFCKYVAFTAVRWRHLLVTGNSPDATGNRTQLAYILYAANGESLHHKADLGSITRYRAILQHLTYNLSVFSFVSLVFFSIFVTDDGSSEGANNIF